MNILKIKPHYDGASQATRSPNRRPTALSMVHGDIGEANGS